MHEKTVLLLMQRGAQHANHMNDIVEQDATFGKMDTPKVAHVAICYAAAISKLAKVELPAALQMFALMFDHLDVTSKETGASMLEPEPEPSRIIKP